MAAKATWCPCLRSEDVRRIYEHLWEEMVATAQGILRDRAEAEEIAQETMVRIAERYCEFRGTAPVKAWAKSITRRLALNRHRESSRRREREEVAMEGRPSPTNPEEIAVGRERLERLAKALDGLPENMARALRQRIADHRSIDEIARHEGVPVGTIMSRLARAKKRLQLIAVPLGRSEP